MLLRHHDSLLDDLQSRCVEIIDLALPQAMSETQAEEHHQRVAAARAMVPRPADLAGDAEDAGGTDAPAIASADSGEGASSGGGGGVGDGALAVAGDAVDETTKTWLDVRAGWATSPHAQALVNISHYDHGGGDAGDGGGGGGGGGDAGDGRVVVADWMAMVNELRFGSGDGDGGGSDRGGLPLVPHSRQLHLASLVYDALASRYGALALSTAPVGGESSLWPHPILAPVPSADEFTADGNGGYGGGGGRRGSIRTNVPGAPTTVASAGHSSQRFSPHRVLCPFELHGTCNDEHCPYQHFDATRTAAAGGQPSSSDADDDAANTSPAASAGSADAAWWASAVPLERFPLDRELPTLNLVPQPQLQPHEVPRPDHQRSQRARPDDGGDRGGTVDGATDSASRKRRHDGGGNAEAEANSGAEGFVEASAEEDDTWKKRRPVTFAPAIKVTEHGEGVSVDADEDSFLALPTPMDHGSHDGDSDGGAEAEASRALRYYGGEGQSEIDSASEAEVEGGAQGESEGLPLFSELKGLDPSVNKLSYMVHGVWDITGLEDDLAIIKQRGKSESEGASLFAELKRLDPSMNERSYKANGRWDVPGLQDDLSIVKKRAAPGTSSGLPGVAIASSTATPMATATATSTATPTAIPTASSSALFQSIFARKVAQGMDASAAAAAALIEAHAEASSPSKRSNPPTAKSVLARSEELAAEAFDTYRATIIDRSAKSRAGGGVDRPDWDPLVTLVER